MNKIQQEQAFLGRCVAQAKVDPASKILLSRLATFSLMRNRLKGVENDINVLHSLLEEAEESDVDADLTDIEGTLLTLSASRRRCAVAVNTRVVVCEAELDERARKLGLPRR